MDEDRANSRRDSWPLTRVGAELNRSLRKSRDRRDCGVETIEWIALAAVVLALLLGVLTVMSPGGQAVATQMLDQITSWVDRWSGGVAALSPAAGEGQEVPSAGGSSFFSNLIQGLETTSANMWDALVNRFGNRGQPVADTSQLEQSHFGDLLSQPAFTSYPATVTEGSVTLSGTGNPGDVLQIYRNGQFVDEVTVRDDGTWSLTIPASWLSIGENTFGVARDGSGVTQTITVGYSPPSTLNVPVRLQYGLGGGRACSAASMGMVFDYYHSQNPHNPNLSTQSIIDLAKSKGWFGRGISADHAAELAKEVGYKHSYWFAGWTMDDLGREINSGHPVIVTVREDIETTGYAHAVVVTGFSSDGSRVMINDPQHGARVITWKDFSRSWSSFTGYPNHGYVVIP